MDSVQILNVTLARSSAWSFYWPSQRLEKAYVSLTLGQEIDFSAVQ